jgi:hypothetical protein
MRAPDPQRGAPPAYGVYLLAGLCGGVWGLGLARTLALARYLPFFHGVTGALITALACALGALLLKRTYPITSIPLLLPAVDLLSGPYHPWRGPALLVGGLALALLVPRRLPRRWGWLLAVLVPLAVYLPDVSPYVGRADTFEFQVVAPRLGIAHPSGYPLYVLIGKLFSLLPLGSVAWRVNLSSALFGALAAGVMFWVLSKPANPKSKIQNPKSTTLLALFAALTLAFSPTLWSRAVEAEVYALNALLVAVGLWLAARWAEGATPTARALPAFGLLTGVALSAHLTLGALALLAAPLIVTGKPKLRTLLLATGLGLAGLALYLYIPLRWPAVTGEAMSAAHFLRFVTNAESGGALRPWAFAQDPARWTLVFRLLRAQVGWVGLALALIGLTRLFRRRWPLALGTLLAFGAWTWFNLSFYVAEPDYSAFLIPAHVVLIYWMGSAGWHIGTSAHRHIQNPKSKIQNLKSQFFVLLALLPLSRLWLTGPELDTVSLGRADEAWGRYALRQPLAPGAAILADSEKFPPLYYLQQVEGLRPDLELVTLFNEAQYREALLTRLDAGQRVYLARYLPGLDALGVSSVGPLVEVAPPPIAPPGEGGVRLEEALHLRAHALERDPEGRAMHHLTLTWEAVAKPTADLVVRLRLRTGDKVAWTGEATRPVNGYTTTAGWQPGQVVRDYHALAWPAWLPAGPYELEVALAPHFTEAGGAATTDALAWHPLAHVTVPAQAPAELARRVDAHWMGAARWLESADVPGEVGAEAPFAIDVTWRGGDDRALGEPVLHWQPQASARPLPPVMLAPGPTAIRTRRYEVHAPARPGRYRLDVAWHVEGAPLAARCAWLGPSRVMCPLAELEVGPSNVGLANFGRRILLVAAEMDAEAVPAGGQLAVDLRWRCLRAMDHDYTVFVQVLGPEGQLYGQVDSWPVQGARPTSTWAVGEEVADPYRFYLQEELPAGAYRVIVGWYRLADMRRLPVVNTQGEAIGDFYEVGGFEYVP